MAGAFQAEADRERTGREQAQSAVADLEAMLRRVLEAVEEREALQQEARGLRVNSRS